MLKPVVKGLRPIHNRSNDVAKTNLVVPAGDTLFVSEEVADQLLRARVGFADGEAPAAGPAPAADDAAAAPAPKSKTVKKS